MSTRIRFQELASRITGISIPVFGISWTPPISERQIIRETFVFLEDRRALYNDFSWEVESEVAQSVLTIRSELTAALKRLPEESAACDSLKAMRAACREYLDTIRSRNRHEAFMIALGRLRTLMGVHLAYLAVKYGIDIEGDLCRTDRSS